MAIAPASPPAPDASARAPLRPPSLRATLIWLLVLHAALAAVIARKPADFFWLDTPMAQVGIFAALALAVVSPTLSVLRRLEPRLLALGQAPPWIAIGASIGFGLVARIGADLGRLCAQAWPYANALEFAFVFPANVLSTGLIFLLTARLLALRAARAPKPDDITARTPNG